MFQAISPGFPTKLLHAFLFSFLAMSLAHLVLTKVGVSFQNSWIAIVLGNKSVSSASLIIRQTGAIFYSSDVHVLKLSLINLLALCIPPWHNSP